MTTEHLPEVPRWGMLVLFDTTGEYVQPRRDPDGTWVTYADLSAAIAAERKRTLQDAREAVAESTVPHLANGRAGVNVLRDAIAAIDALAGES